MSDWNNVKSIFLAAAEKPVSERPAYLEQTVGADAVLRARIEALLKAHDNPDSFLEEPVAEFGATVELSADPSLAERPGTVIGPYKLLQQIGEGGMGVVFMAEQAEPLQRTVALKIIKPGMDTRQVIARFEAERQAVAMMDHPNIARVLDAGTTATGRPYFVMDLVKGVPITDYCNQQHLPIRARLEVISAVCHAVQHAHQKGIIHRDLKPSNVLVAEYDGKPVPKIIDFGVAKATAQRLTEKTMFTEYGQLIGTFEYMSPEQARFNQLDVDTRSDIYSLGVLLYEVLAGSTPLEKERLRSAAFDEVLRIICEEEPPRPSLRLSSSQLLPSISAQRQIEPAKLKKLVRGELDWIVMKCLEKDRNRRYETANGLAEDIESYLSDQPVDACPPSAVYRFRKFIHRNKAALLSLAVVTAALIVGTIASTWQAIRATRAETLADTRLHDERLARQDLKGTNDQLAAQLTRAETAEQLANTQARQLSQRLYEIKFPSAVGDYRSDQFQRAREELDECPANQRRWEWYWLDHEVRQSTPLKIRGRQLIEFTPDGRHFVTVDGVDEKSVKFWNATTGGVERVMAPSKVALKQLRLSADGRRLVISTVDGLITMWDVLSAEQIWSVKAHALRSDGFAFSPDGTRLASAGWDGALKVFRVDDGKELVAGHVDDALRSVCFSRDGSRLVTARTDTKIINKSPARVWDANTGKLIFELANSAPRSAAYSPDGRWIAAGGNDGIVRIYDADTGTKANEWHAHTNYVSGLAYSPDGTRLATSSADSKVCLWDAETGKAVSTFAVHAVGANFVSFSRDGRRLASSDPYGVAYVFDLVPDESFTTMPVDSFARTNMPVRSAVFSPDGAHLLTATVAGEVKALNAATLVEDRIITFSGCREVAYAPDGQHFAAATGETIIVVNVATGEVVRQLSGHQGVVDIVAYSPDGKLLASAANDETIRLWDVKTGILVHALRGHRLQPTERKGNAIWSLAFRPDGLHIASAAIDGLRVWNVDTGAQLLSLSVGAALTSVTYNIDGSRILSGGSDRLIHEWDAQTGKELPGFGGGHVGTVWALAISPDGFRLASGDETGMVRIWSAETGASLLTLQESDNASLYGLTFSPDGRTILAARANGAIQLWETEVPRQDVASRSLALIASRRATAALQTQAWPDTVIESIRADASIGDNVKQLSVRLAEQRMAAIKALVSYHLDSFRRAAEAPGGDAVALNSYAWELLMIEPTQLRQPATALPMAKRAVEMTGGKNGAVLDTLAEAYFQTGAIAKAVETEQKVVDLLTPEAADRATYIERMDRFKATLESLKGNDNPDRTPTSATQP